MPLSIDFERPYFTEEQLLTMTPTDLDDFYGKASETDRLNLFFLLECSYHRLLEGDQRRAAARCAFLMAYYLFVPLTPPASGELGEYYIRRAAALDPLPEYQEWEDLIGRGN